MFMDYITLMLVNMAAGLLVLAAFFVFGLDRPGQRNWAAAFAAVGIVALAMGYHMTTTWPIPDLSKAGPHMSNLKFANVAFGETTVLLGAIFLALSLATAMGWELMPVGVLAVLPGLAAIVLGAAISHGNLTQSPALTTAGFVLSGLGGLLAPLAIGLRKMNMVRYGMAVILLAASGIWTLVGMGAYWMHIENFSK